MSSAARAILLDFGAGVHAAIAAGQLVELVYAPALDRVPLAPQHCNELLSWGDTFVPVLDLAKLIASDAQDLTEAVLVALVRYRAGSVGASFLGGLKIRGYPRLVVVNDSMASPLPSAGFPWQAFSHSCFELESEQLPILDLRRVFSRVFASGLRDQVTTTKTSSSLSVGVP